MVNPHQKTCHRIPILFTAFLILLAGMLLTGQPLRAQVLADSTKRAEFSVESIGKGDGPGETRIRARIDIEENWHLQANETKEDLVPTRLKVIKPQGARVKQINYPEPHKIKLPPYGRVDVFEGTVQIDATVAVPEAHQSGGTATLELELTGQACDDKSCMPPGTWTATIESPVREGAPSPSAETETGGNDPDGDRNTSSDSKKKQSEETESASRTSGIHFLIPSSTPDKPPQEVINELGLSVDETKTSKFQRKINSSLILALLFAFFWGLASSLSPCVYPMIPLTLSYFGTQGSTPDGGDDTENSEPYARVVGLAFVYSLGVSLTFAVLGVVAAMVGVELGAPLGNPWFLGFLIVLFILLALSMMELFEIPVPSSLQGMAGGKPGVAGAFTMGILLGFIAAPCVGPFAAAILAFISASGDVFVGFAGMFSFGLGLSMLFLVLALFGGYSSALSTGTAWLKEVKIFWGFVLLAVNIYFIDLWMSIVGWGSQATWATPLLVGVISVIFGFWLWSISREDEDETGGRLALRATGKGTAALLLLLGSFSSLGAFARSEFLFPAPGWLETQVKFEGKANVDSFPEAVRRAKQQRKPIFIDFYADWCIPCKQMDDTVFSDPDVGAFMNENFVNVKLDASDGSGWNTKLKANVFKSSAMPFYAFFDAQGNYVPQASFGKKASKETFLKHARRALDRKKTAGSTSSGPSSS